MKKIFLMLVLVIVSTNASAATAFLTGSCQMQNSVTGMLIYVGTYQYGGHYFTKAFTSWCPMSIEIY